MATALVVPAWVRSKAASEGYPGTPEKGISRLDPNTANERRVVGPDSWLYSGQ
jgi:hypothetical protein